MSRIAVVLLVAALVLTAPGFAVGAGELEKISHTAAEQSEEAKPCAGGSEAALSREARYCAARSEKAEVQEIPIYVPPNRGSPPTRIGGGSRGGVSPLRSI